jgi:hypothetical protein
VLGHSFPSRRSADLVAHASKVGLGTWIGLLLGAVLKVVIAFLMIATFAAAYMIA